MSVAVSRTAPALTAPLILAPDGSLEWGARTPKILPESPEDKFYTTREGDRLPLLAWKYYGNFRLWWVLYDNNLDTLTGHPMDVPAGKTLRIPAFTTVQMELTHGTD